MFLWSCPDRGLGGARSHGLLSLPLVPFVVGWTRQRVHALETRCRADHGRLRTRRHVPEDAGEPAAILQAVRRPFVDQSPAAPIGRPDLGHIADAEVWLTPAHQVRR